MPHLQRAQRVEQVHRRQTQTEVGYHHLSCSRLKRRKLFSNSLCVSYKAYFVNPFPTRQYPPYLGLLKSPHLAERRGDTRVVACGQRIA
jgi:hypothetical protein